MNPTLQPPDNLPSIQPATGLLAPGHTIHGYALAESAFLDAIRQERRRSERSGRPFLLMLARLQNLPANGTRIGVIRKLLSTVRGCVRETDAVGWYRQNQVLGVIFTELGDADQATVLASLKQRTINKIDNSSRDVKNLGLSYTFHFFPEDSEPNGRAMDFKLYPELSQETWLRKVALGIKRGIDLLGSILALALLCGLLFAIAVLIKLTSKGPILFRQTRIGQHGKAFTFLKFRSMYVNNDPTIHQDYVTRFIAGRAELNARDGGPSVYKITNDPRITPLGRFLRKTSMDELPQLINVLKGEMSLIGPRPPLPYEFECYDLWHRRRVLEVKPGITGLWQVSGRSRTSFDEMVRLDLHYTRNWSLWLDFKILLVTPRAVLSGDGAH